jgi:hypothetical protein
VTGIVCVCVEQGSNPLILAKMYGAYGPSCSVVVTFFSVKINIEMPDVLFENCPGLRFVKIPARLATCVYACSLRDFYRRAAETKMSHHYDALDFISLDYLLKSLIRKG